MKNARVSKYWICVPCAKKRKWKAPKHSVTAILGLCGHCISAEKVVLIPTCDFSGTGKKAIFD